MWRWPLATIYVDLPSDTVFGSANITSANFRFGCKDGTQTSANGSGLTVITASTIDPTVTFTNNILDPRTYQFPVFMSSQNTSTSAVGSTEARTLIQTLTSTLILTPTLTLTTKAIINPNPKQVLPKLGYHQQQRSATHRIGLTEQTIS